MCRFTPVRAFSAPDPAQRKRNQTAEPIALSVPVKGKLPSVRTFATRSHPSELTSAPCDSRNEHPAIGRAATPFAIAGSPGSGRSTYRSIRWHRVAINVSPLWAAAALDDTCEPVVDRLTEESILRSEKLCLALPTCSF